MTGYLFTIFYNTQFSKDKLWIVVGSNGQPLTDIQACEKAIELLKEAGQEGVIEITGCERLV